MCGDGWCSGDVGCVMVVRVVVGVVAVVCV